MPHGKKHFQKSWSKLIRIDIVLENGWRKIKLYTLQHVHCSACHSNVTTLAGLNQIMVHAEGKGHIKTAQRFFKNQKHNFHVRMSKINYIPKQESHWLSDSHRGYVMHERLACNYSCNSCEDLSGLFWFMFPCPYTRDFSLGRTNWDVTSDGLGPYVQNLLYVSHCEEKWHTIFWWNGHCTKPDKVGLTATMDEVRNSFLVEVWMRTI